MTDDQNVWTQAYAAALAGTTAHIGPCANVGGRGDDCAVLADEAVAQFRERFPVEPNRPRAEAPLGPPLGGAE